MKLMVCTLQRHAPNPHSCGNGGGEEIAAQLEREIAESGLLVQVERMSCLGMCLKGPNVQLQPEWRNWHAVHLGQVGEIVACLKQHDEKL